MEMTKKELEQDLRKLKQSSGITHGEKIYCHLGEKGVRGLAMSGYPILCELTVPHMKQYIANNRDQNQINVQILLEIIGELTDTNVISRTSEKEMRWLQTEARAILKTGGAFCAEGLQKVRELNQICIRKNMAPAAPKAAPAPAAAPKAAAGAAGAVSVKAPMPGNILDVKVSAGASVKAGDVLVILEAMKMENEILAPQDGTVASVNVNKGDTVNSGDVLVSMN